MKFLIIILNVFALNIVYVNAYRYSSTAICERNKSYNNNTFYRLPKTVTPIRYRLKFRSETNRYKFYGSETILVMINNKTDIIELNSVDLNIESAWFRTRRIRVDVKTIYSCPEKETIVLQFYKTLDKGSGNLTINFNGNINSMVTGFYRTEVSSVSDEGGLIAVTDFGPSDSRRAFPNWDEPAFKASIELTLITLRNHNVLTNMNEQKRRDHNSEMEEIRFNTSPPMTSGLLAIVVGKFDFIEQLTDDKEVLVRVFTPLYRQNEAMFAMEVTNKLLLYFKYYFNTSYPLLKLDLVSISDFPSAMETWGLITFTETEILVNNQTTEEEKRTVAVVIAHALAHQWFGNLATFEAWNDVWITEGFATFIENQAIDILYPNWKLWHNFVAKDFQNCIELDSRITSQPIDTKMDFPKEIERKFNAFSYQKSAAIVRMIEDWIGKEKFRKGIRIYLEKYQFKSSLSSDLWQSFETQNDIKLKEMVDSWAKQRGFPVINVKERQSGQNRILNVTQEKFMPIEKFTNKSSVGHLWHIPIKITNLFSPYIPSAEVLMTAKQQEITVENVWDGEWIKLNHNSHGFYRVNYPIEMLNKFIKSIEDKSMPALDRLNIISDLFAMIQSGRMSTQIGLSYLLHYKNDDNLAVWDYILKLMTKLDVLLSDTNLREDFWLFGRELLSGLRDKFGWDVKSDEDIRISKLRSQLLDLLAIFRDKKVIAEGVKRYEDYKSGNFNGTEDLLITVYKIVGMNCEEQTFDEFFEMYKSAGNEVKRNHIIMALTSTSQKERVLKVLDFAISENIRFIDSSKIISGLCHSLIGRDKTWKFFEKNFDEIERMFGSSTEEIKILIKNFIEMFSSEDKANEFEVFFEMKRIPGLLKSIETSLENIRINAKWLNRDIIAIREYLTKYSSDKKLKIT